MLYRIYTEKKNQECVEQIVLGHFPVHGYTMFDAIGYWRGNKEDTLVIEVECHEHDRFKIDAIASKIKTVNSQEAVLVVSIQSSARLY